MPDPRAREPKMSRTKLLVALIAATLMASPVQARKVSNPEWPKWNLQRTSVCAVFRAFGYGSRCVR